MITERKTIYFDLHKADNNLKHEIGFPVKHMIF